MFDAGEAATVHLDRAVQAGDGAGIGRRPRSRRRGITDRVVADGVAAAAATMLIARCVLAGRRGPGRRLEELVAGDGPGGAVRGDEDAVRCCAVR